MKLTATKKIVILLILLSMAAYGAASILFLKIKRINENVSFLQNNIESDLNRQTVLQAVKTIVLDTEYERSKLDTYIVGKQNVVDFITLVENTASHIKLPLDVTSFNEIESPKSSYTELSLKAATSGAWADVVRFLALVETLPYKNSIKEATFDKRKEGEKEKWFTTIQVNTLKFK